MEPNKQIGHGDAVNVMQPGKVTNSLNLHEEHNMQDHLPQNGGEIAAEKEKACYDESM